MPANTSGRAARKRSNAAAKRRSSSARARRFDAARRDLLLPARPQRSDPGEQLRGAGLAGGRSRASAGDGVLEASSLDLRANRLAGGHAFAARDLVPLRVARKEPIARRAEPLPDHLRPALLDRADRLPLRLQPLDLGGGRLPVGRIGQRLDLDAQRLLLARSSPPRPSCAWRDRRGAARRSGRRRRGTAPTRPFPGRATPGRSSSIQPAAS